MAVQLRVPIDAICSAVSLFQAELEASTTSMFHIRLNGAPREGDAFAAQIVSNTVVSAHAVRQDQGGPSWRHSG